MYLLKRLSLDDLIDEMTVTPPAALDLTRLQDWMGRLELPACWVRDRLSFSEKSYTRSLLCRTPQFDLLLLGWRPGQISTIHDHQDSLNVTRIEEGCLTSRCFERSSGGGLVQTSEDYFKKGDRLCVDRYEIHQLANTSEENLVTLHVYARSLVNLTVYRLDGQSESVRCLIS